MHKNSFLTIFALILVVASSGVAFVNIACAQNAQSETVRDVENYLTSLKTLKARFVQTASDGTQETGVFYLKRPGRLRFEYDAPREDFIVADGVFIYFYDAELEQQTNAPIGATLADFFLRKTISLSDGVKVTHLDKVDTLTKISVVEADDPDAGALTLGLTGGENGTPYALKKWRIEDGFGNITEIELFDAQEGLDLAKNLFVYFDPKPTQMNN
jgi:outer membrane lipoprotein-sorting protein